MRSILLILSILGFTLISIVGCSKTLPENVCDMENPLTDLDWLRQIIENWEENSRNGFSVSSKIYQCTYDNNKIGFLIDYCVDCPDAGYSFMSCDGTILCGGGGIDGKDTCGELNIDFANEKLIYEHK